MSAGEEFVRMSGSSEKKMCSAHDDNVLKYFCSTCKKSLCTDCYRILDCYTKGHDVISMKDAENSFNEKAKDALKNAGDVIKILERKLDAIVVQETKYNHQLDLCKEAIEMQRRVAIEHINENHKRLSKQLGHLKERKDRAKTKHFEVFDTKKTEVEAMTTKVKATMNDPEQTETLTSLTKEIKDFKDKVTRRDDDPQKGNILPKFISSSQLLDVIKTQGLGEIINVNDLYKVDGKPITVTKGQPFMIRVKSGKGSGSSDDDGLTAILKNYPSIECAEVKYRGDGEYNIIGKCSEEGRWEMRLTTGDAHIEGSPLDVKVENEMYEIHTIDNISYFKKDKGGQVTDVLLDKNGHILVSSYSNYILKFSKSGSFVEKATVRRDREVVRMHRVGYCDMVYSEYTKRCVVVCNYALKKIRSFGKGTLKYPMGLAVNNVTDVVYVADSEAHCVFKFNIKDGESLGQIGSGKLFKPYDVTLMKTGHVIVADYESSKLQMFDSDGNYIRVFVEKGREDGEVIAPCGVVTDINDNIVVASNHKLQLFDKDGAFIKRIDHKDDGLDTPFGITVIAGRPRRKVAVANHGANNVKIYTY
ncbi:uncharacterized protein [Antedon mediterranea]|uniref:uncharacterized protein n=1 Tax=Antedon mediterranea TaxID=105859 RepID=UPI003AF9C072